MAAIRSTIALLMLVASIQAGTALKIKTEPSTEIDISTGSLQVSCLPETKNETKEVVILEVFHDNSLDPIALIRQNNKIAYGRHILRRSNIVATGHVTHAVNESFLTVDIPYPPNAYNGTFKCVMYYLSEENVLSREEATHQLTWSEPDEDTLQALEASLLKKIKALENHHTQTGKTILERLADLEEFYKIQEGTKAQKRDILGRLQELETRQSMVDRNITKLETEFKDLPAFFATANKPVQFKKSTAIAFPSTPLNTGGYYNETTGIFTTLRDGVWSFCLTLKVQDKDSLFDFVVKNKFAAMLYAGKSEGSLDIVQTLKKGDKVKVVSKDSGTLEANDSSFSGYLIHEL